ncbi:DUF4810 domain-containing protein [Uliginosibacterium sp. 31-16]|uniref:DUF4810 domain-containing protein n=1 Tax=Uliginosibacterium sp. 31-16 TaxID=3068315 RepID=UPI00273F7A4E|nr:DUF4810 domain-containing protein [Uliginosibacterium sp. 31-16]MDP5239023.1 DUF4810 domain-containing protein [Uliginosibacterium sp. 31-16]
MNLNCRFFAALLALALLAGCAGTPTLYHWGSYQPQVYTYLKAQDGDHNAEILALQKTQEEARAANKALPPGFHAHLGMLHIAEGKPDLARQAFEAEKALFPESTTYMDFMLAKLGGGEKK